ncbi:MAG: penicillin-binding protein 2 [Candidatus Muproteobacteria bacterium RBG_16_64_11]|uniref:Peptidoglycan D,D-transpeptidase MrdA n=1 Tax=Candidatus Muproteobacteria bacterium RBG_16_64_11 TaxID=1817758 RepID=A0A1F6THQ9_9PROT|nr:MAG: penicillin-binding protein 2 [Candidatus Muproteobacteria bacterium RBG_16_64_11]
MKRPAIKDYLRESRLFNLRVGVSLALVAFLALILFVRLVYLQVVSHRHYATLSQENSVKPLPVTPVRGLILDRNGVVLAQNFPVLTLEITPYQVANMKALLEELGTVVTLNERDLKNFERLRRSRPRFESLTIRTQLSEEEAARFAVNRHRFNGVELRARLQRHYPHGALAVHALGYVGRINEAEAEAVDKAAYRGSQHIGKLGVEQSYEDILLGEVGAEKVETNAHGRALRVLERIAPKAGYNLYLNLDIKLQAIAEQSLGQYKGAVVAIEPKSGAVLAFASTPTYDPNPFVNGIDTESYQSLRDDPNKPLINRALYGRYSPGSTIKAFLGLAALEFNQNPERTVFCPGWYSLPGDTHRFRCWKKDGHGAVNLHDAVVQSCDVYFYQLAVALGIERMHSFLAGFGFGARTGVDLKGESSGLLPSPAWKKARGLPWYGGETVITGIGQGLILATPLQLASAMATLANRGVRLQPRMAHGFIDPKSREVHLFEPRPLDPLALQDAEHLEATFNNLTDVVHGAGGTARGIGWNAPYKIAGKTGTAQVKGIGQQEVYVEGAVPLHLRDHALFVAFAPVDDPQIAVAVIAENGGHGSSTAAPIARKVMDYYLLGRDRPMVNVPVGEGD